MLEAATDIAPWDHWVRQNYLETLVLESSMLSDRIVELDSPAPTPTDAEKLTHLHWQLAISQMDLERFCCAARTCLRCLELSPTAAAEPWLLLGQALRAEGRFVAAEAVLRHYLLLKPDDAPAMSELGSVLITLSRWEEAESLLAKSRDLDPRLARPWAVMSGLSFLQGRYQEAQRFMEEAMSRGESKLITTFNLGMHHLSLGEFQPGWNLYETRSMVVKRQFFGFPWDQPRWEGDAQEGKTILIQAEQGYGDIIQFARFLPAVKARCARVILGCPTSLMNLLRRCDGVDAVVDNDHVPRGSLDLHAPIASLPRLLNLETEKAMRPRGPYVFADALSVQAWRDRLHAVRALRVGLVWASHSRFVYREQKSIPFESMRTLIGIHGTACISLQVSPRRHRPPALPDLLDLTEDLVDFDETAALLANLDLVISVDTSVAHLAGAMGKPVWLLVMDGGDWRWMRDREDSPWYPSMRIFRQAAPGDWDSTLARVRQALTQLAADKKGLSDFRPDA